MDKLLLNKNIIVTGTAKGMGKSMVKLFAENGANIFALARIETDEHKKFCENLANINSVKIFPLYFDMTNYEKMKEIVNKIREYKMPIDGLVNNAGITYNALFQMTNIEELRKQFEVNFFAQYIFTQYISKLMLRNGKGSIVSISSSAALDCNSGKSAYGASKAALLCMGKCISQELADNNIRSNIICPGVIETSMLGTMPDYILEIQKEASCLKDVGDPIDIANTALFLLSDKSSYITGQIYKVDGGITQYNKRK